MQDEYEALNPPKDDCGHLFQSVLEGLTPAEFEEWKRQADELIDLIPTYGSFAAALDAYEKEHSKSV